MAVSYLPRTTVRLFTLNLSQSFISVLVVFVCLSVSSATQNSPLQERLAVDRFQTSGPSSTILTLIYATNPSCSTAAKSLSKTSNVSFTDASCTGNSLSFGFNGIGSLSNLGGPSCAVFNSVRSVILQYEGTNACIASRDSMCSSCVKLSPCSSSQITASYSCSTCSEAVFTVLNLSGLTLIDLPSVC